MEKQSSDFFFRHIVLSFSILCLCFLVYTCAKFYNHYSYAKNEHPNHSQANKAANYLSDSMRLPLWNISATLAEPYIEAILLAYPEIENVVVTNIREHEFYNAKQNKSELGMFSSESQWIENGNSLNYDLSSQGNYSESNATYGVVTKTVSYEGDLLGKVSVYYKKTSPIAYGWNQISSDVLYFIFQLMAFALISWMVTFRKSMGRVRLVTADLEHS